jgi:hypothetical protein
MTCTVPAALSPKGTLPRSRLVGMMARRQSEWILPVSGTSTLGRAGSSDATIKAPVRCRGTLTSVGLKVT